MVFREYTIISLYVWYQVKKISYCKYILIIFINYTIHICISYESRCIIKNCTCWTIYKHMYLDWNFFFFLLIFLFWFESNKLLEFFNAKLLGYSIESHKKKMSMSFSPFSSPTKFGSYTWHFTFTFTNFFSILWTCIKCQFYYYHW